MKLLFKYMLTAGLIVSSTFVAAGESNGAYQGKVQTCRALQGGEFQVIFKSLSEKATGCTTTNVIIADKAVVRSDRKTFLAACYMAQASNFDLRIDYLKCNSKGTPIALNIDDDPTTSVNENEKTSFQVVN